MKRNKTIEIMVALTVFFFVVGIIINSSSNKRNPAEIEEKINLDVGKVREIMRLGLKEVKWNELHLEKIYENSGKKILGITKEPDKDIILYRLYGTMEFGFDLNSLNENDVIIDKSAHSVKIQCPEAQIISNYLDFSRSKSDVLADSRKVDFTDRDTNTMYSKIQQYAESRVMETINPIDETNKTFERLMKKYVKTIYGDDWDCEISFQKQ